MEITVEFSDSALWGQTDPDEEGYGAEASARKFSRDLLAALAREYPKAEILVKGGINDRHMVDDREDTAEAENVGEIINEVWESWEWMVEAD